MTPKKITLPSGEIRWSVRYRTPDGKQPQRRFQRRADAVAFEAKMRTQMMAGSYVDPKEQRQTFATLAERHWTAHEHNLAADTTRVVKRSRLDKHILPTIGAVPLAGLRPSTINAAIASWSATLAPGTVAQVVRQVRQILDSALADGLIAANPAKAPTVRVPKAPRRRDVHLTDENVSALVTAARPSEPDGYDYSPLVITLAGLGLRISEACGLRVTDVDWLRRIVRVKQQRRPNGEMGKLKTETSYREIPADDVVLAGLAGQVRRVPRSDGLIFSTTTGRALTKSVAGHVFDDLEKATGLTASPHSLRHYFGASLISRGVNVVAVSKWLGHSDPSITYRIYSYMLPSDEDAGRAAMREVGVLLADSCAISVPHSGVEHGAGQ